MEPKGADIGNIHVNGWSGENLGKERRMRHKTVHGQQLRENDREGTNEQTSRAGGEKPPPTTLERQVPG